MACLSLTSLPITCGSDGLIAGISKLYMVAAMDLTNVAGSTRPYVMASNGVLNQISLKTSKKFVEIGQIKNQAGITETGVFSDNGTNFSTVELTMSLLNISTENQAWVSNVKNQEVACIVLSKSGQYFGIGFNGSLKLSAYTGGLGQADTDMIGYTLTFSGSDTFGIKLIENSVATGAIAIA